MRTAKIRPRTVQTSGATTTQIALLRSARNVSGSVNIEP
jgi:hypothetical protein